MFNCALKTSCWLPHRAPNVGHCQQPYSGRGFPLVRSHHFAARRPNLEYGVKDQSIKQINKCIDVSINKYILKFVFLRLHPPDEVIADRSLDLCGSLFSLERYYIMYMC